jgi:uncharacterized membrane protein YhiD involved in acid resistance
MIWVNAAIGVAVGGGEYRLAVIATVVTVVVIVVLNPVEAWIDRKTPAGNSNSQPPTSDSQSPPETKRSPA